MKQIYLAINAAGCDTTCVHCWANGGHYKNMPFSDIKFVVNSFKDYFENNEYKVGFGIMHELLAHPEAIQIKQFQNEQEKSMPNPLFAHNRIPTSGIPIAIREDYKELLDGLLKNNVENLHMVLHGFMETHNKAVNNKDAFVKLKIATERAKEAGLKCTFSVLLTKSNITELKEIKNFLYSLGVDKATGGSTGNSLVARYYPGKRAYKYDEIRIEYSDIINHNEEIKELYAEDLYRNLENYTESALYQKAVDGKEIRTDFDISISGTTIHVLCDKDYNIFSGHSIIVGKNYGNLKNEADKVFEKLRSDIINDNMGYEFIPSLFYPNEIIPPVKELAEKYGDKNSQKIYTSGIYYKWLDNAFLKP